MTEPTEKQVTLSDLLSEQEQGAIVMAYSLGQLRRSGSIKMEQGDLRKILIFAAEARMNQRIVDAMCAGKISPYVDTDGEVKFDGLQHEVTL